VCKSKAGLYLGKDYPTCPVREMVDDHHLQLGLMLERQSEVSHIEHWPDGWASWVFDILIQIKGARAQRQHGELKNASRR